MTENLALALALAPALAQTVRAAPVVEAARQTAATATGAVLGRTVTIAAVMRMIRGAAVKTRKGKRKKPSKKIRSVQH